MDVYNNGDDDKWVTVLKYTTHFSVLRRNLSDTIPMTKIHHSTE